MPSNESQAPEITWDLVRKRNFVERLKNEKGGLAVLDDLPAMIDAGYEAVPEEDFVRMQWYGLYHDKPKIGHFMLRVKLPGGQLTPAKLRTMGEISQRFGRGFGELTTRQNIQLHWIQTRRAARGDADSGRRRAHHGGRLRRQRAHHHRLPGGGDRRRGAVRRASRCSRRSPASSSRTGSTRTCRASTRSPSRPARTSATRRRSTASPSSAPCGTAGPVSACGWAAGSPPGPGWRTTSGCGCR